MIYLAFIFILFNLIKNDKGKIRILLCGSLLFYFYHETLFTPILLIISLIAYLAGEGIFRYKNHKKKILWSFLLILLSLYFPLKYSEAFENIWNDFLRLEGLRWLYLPMGLSFYAFKSMSYVFDIYYERSVPQKSVEKYLLYISYFPQIFCGPIMGADEFFKQLVFKDKPESSEVLDGLRLIALGFFKKLVLANNLLLLIQDAFARPVGIKAIEWVIISVIARFYVYFDFGGYSDISNGVSLLFGIKVQKNFDQPFRSKSITEFWRRWHISLSNWIRDYVYYPLVSKFSSYAGIYIGLIISFIILGLWHGIQINYILYGLINGIAVASGTYLSKRKRGAPPASSIRIFISRLWLYLFLIFLPALLLMSHDGQALSVILESFAWKQSWFELKYFSGKEFLPITIIVTQLAFIFELAVCSYGDRLLGSYTKSSSLTKITILVISILVTFSLLSPVVNYRFLYQGF